MRPFGELVHLCASGQLRHALAKRAICSSRRSRSGATVPAGQVTVCVTELPISRADRATADVRGRASHEAYSVSSTPSHPKRADVALAIDRWNNEGGFVHDEATLGGWLRRRCSGADG